MRRLALALALLLVVACGGGESDPTPRETMDVRWVDIGFGNDVARLTIDGADCVVVDGQNGAAGISCDWGQG